MIAPGRKIAAYAYNRTVPGPILRAEEVLKTNLECPGEESRNRVLTLHKSAFLRNHVDVVGQVLDVELKCEPRPLAGRNGIPTDGEILRKMFGAANAASFQDLGVPVRRRPLFMTVIPDAMSPRSS